MKVGVGDRVKVAEQRPGEGEAFGTVLAVSDTLDLPCAQVQFEGTGQVLWCEQAELTVVEEG